MSSGPHRGGSPYRARWFGRRSKVAAIADDVSSIREQLAELTERLPVFEAQLWRASGRPPPSGADPMTREDPR